MKERQAPSRHKIFRGATISQPQLCVSAALREHPYTLVFEQNREGTKEVMLRKNRSCCFCGLASFPAVHKSQPMPTSPEADPRFHDFVMLQAQNAGLFLGQIPSPQTGDKSVSLRAAKSVIDSLGMLKAKTAGNLTDTEEKLLELALKNLVPLYKTTLDNSDSSDS